MYARGILSIALSPLVLLGAGAPPSARAADPTARVRLKGSSHIDVHAAREAGALVLSGIVVDDAARPVPGARVVIWLALASDPSGARITLPASAPQSCGGAETTARFERADSLVLAADGAARFCVRLALATNHYVAHVEARSSELLDGSMLDLPIDLALPAVTLRFDPERSSLSLDDDTTSLDVIASTEEDGVTSPAAGLVLSLSNEAAAPLAGAMTDGAGHARFAVDSARLGAPGKGELHVTFGGSPAAGATSHSMRVERWTAVDLLAPEARGPRLPIAWPEDGVAVRLVASPRCAPRGCNATPGGTIEARVARNTLVGAAPIQSGEAHLSFVFAAPSVDAIANPDAVEVPVTLRYVPNAPWFRPAAELVLLQPVGGPSPWKRVPLILAAAIVVAWLAIARFPMRREEKARSPARPPRSLRAVPRVELLRRVSPSQGWTGRVTDAHDGVEVPGARVALERRGFERVEVVFETTSDTAGAFALPPVEARPGDELFVEGPLHAALRHPLPPPGELAVAVVLRKRALLDRLVAWARRQGPPHFGALDPTPRDVERAAGSNASVARWANAVERAVYGSGAVDAHTQAAVEDLAPKDDHLGRR